MKSIIVVLSVLLLSMTGCKQEEKLPNFLFILVDDLGWTDLGCFGSTFYDTPNIDDMAGEGIRFTNAYAACPVCSPTRASIMTGKYPASMQTTDWFGAPQPENVERHWTRNMPLLPAPYVDHLPLREITIAEAIGEAGYRTFFAGKWHLGMTEEYWPEHQGFDINKGGYFRGAPYRNKEKGFNGYFTPYGNPRLEDGPKGEHLPARLASETIRFIEGNTDQPFFAYLSFYSVHTPLQSREDLLEKYNARKLDRGLEDRFDEEPPRKVRAVQCHPVYGGMVEAMDEAVGSVIDVLKEKGLYDNTVIFFMSDNGGLSTSEGSPTSNYPLRAGKGWLYEGGIREPMIIKWNKADRGSSVIEEPVISNDFFPTILEMAGLPLRPELHTGGVSLVPLIKDREFQRGAIYWHYPHYGNQGGTPGSAIREGDWKLIEWFEGGRLELYNLREDIGEKINLSEEFPEIRDQLYEKLVAWRDAQGAKYPSQNPNVKIQEK